MRNLIDAIQSSCNQENWYAALFLALTLPDVCSKLQDPTAKSPGERYREWFDKYLKAKYKSEFHGPDFYFLLASDCWALRCSLLHEGSDDVTGQKSRDTLAKFQFTTQNLHRGLVDGKILVLNVAAFCSEVIQGVEAWLADTQSDAAIQDRISNMVRIELAGFSPAPGIWLGSDDELDHLEEAP